MSNRPHHQHSLNALSAHCGMTTNQKKMMSRCRRDGEQVKRDKKKVPLRQSCDDTVERRDLFLERPRESDGTFADPGTQRPSQMSASPDPCTPFAFLPRYSSDGRYCKASNPEKSSRVTKRDGMRGWKEAK
jgi:hypothetical protein